MHTSIQDEAQSRIQAKRLCEAWAEVPPQSRHSTGSSKQESGELGSGNSPAKRWDTVELVAARDGPRCRITPEERKSWKDKHQDSVVAGGDGLKAGAFSSQGGDAAFGACMNKKSRYIWYSTPAISHNCECTSNVAEVALKADITLPQPNVSSSLKRELHSEKCIAVKSIDKPDVYFYYQNSSLN